MSKIALVGPASGTATFSITTPSGTSTDRTVTLPDVGGTVAVASSGTPSSSTFLRGDNTWATVEGITQTTGAAPYYGARAWVNFDGTTSSPSTIRASANVSSVTKNGTGNYTINFTTAMPDASYSVGGNVERADTGNNEFPGVYVFNGGRLTTSVRVQSAFTFTNPVDFPGIFIQVFR
jgi:hypothetical protein